MTSLEHRVRWYDYRNNRFLLMLALYLLIPLALRIMQALSGSHPSDDIGYALPATLFLAFIAPMMHPNAALVLLGSVVAVLCSQSHRMLLVCALGYAVTLSVFWALTVATPCVPNCL